MTESHPTPYGFEQRLPGATFGAAIECVTAALQTEGGACNPSLAHQALSLEPQQTADGEVVASIADPRAMFAMVDNAQLTPIVDDVERRLRRVMRTLATGDGG